MHGQHEVFRRFIPQDTSPALSRQQIETDGCNIYQAVTDLRTVMGVTFPEVHVNSTKRYCPFPRPEVKYYWAGAKVETDENREIRLNLMVTDPNIQQVFVRLIP